MTLFDDIIEVDELIRSKRRTISIIIDNDAKVIVRAPLKAPVNDILKFVRQKKNWIMEKQRVIKEQIRKQKPKLYLSGETFLYMGKEYPLVFEREVNYAFKFDGENFRANFECKSIIKEVFGKWYKLAAKKHISERISQISAATGLVYTGLRINSAKKRWGSCSSKRILNISYRLILTPEFIIDYIIIHELAHTLEMNHSKKFWKIVEKHCPDYKKAEKWLKLNSSTHEL